MNNIASIFIHLKISIYGEMIYTELALPKTRDW